MSKIKEKRKVLLNVDEDWFKSRGATIHLVKYWIYYGVPFLIILGIGVYAEAGSILSWLAVGLLVILYVVVWINLSKAGKRYWAKERNRQEDILELPPLPRLFGKRKSQE